MEGSGGLTSFKSMVSSTICSSCGSSAPPISASKTVAEAVACRLPVVLLTSYRSVVMVVVEEEVTTLLLLALMCIDERMGTDCSNMFAAVLLVNGFDESEKTTAAPSESGAAEVGSSGTASNGLSDEEAASLVADVVTSWETTVVEKVSKEEVEVVVMREDAPDEVDPDEVDVVVLVVAFEGGFDVVLAEYSEMFNCASSSMISSCDLELLPLALRAL